MDGNDDRTPPTAPPGAPRPGQPPAAGQPPVAARQPIIVIRVHRSTEEKLRRAWSSCDDFLARLTALLEMIDETKAARRAGARVEGGDRARKGKVRPRLPPVWIESLSMTRDPSGSLEVIVNDVRVVLKPHLGALFLALAADTGLSDDEGIGFKTLDDLAARMAKITGGRILSDKTVNKYIYRLRQVLIELAGLTSDVIQSRYRWGRRLAIKRITLGQGGVSRPHAAGSSLHSSSGSAER